MYIKTYQCEYCRSFFSYTNIGRHLQKCIQNPNSEKYKKQNKERICEKCGKTYTLAHELGSTERFCSIGCRNSRFFSEESKKKKAEATKNYWKKHPIRVCSDETREKLRQAGKKSAQIQKNSRRSKIEALFFEKIKKIFSDAEPNKVLVDGWDTDVFLPTEKIAIFWNGAVHYFPIYGQKNLNNVQNRDKIKKSLFENAGYKVYVIKDIEEVYPKEILKDRDKRTEFQLNLFLKSL